MAQQAAPTSSTKSTVITNLDASPLIRPNFGQGGPARLVTAWGTASITATQATTVATRLVRIPSSAIVKKVRVAIETAAGATTVTTCTGALGLLWSDNSVNLDGTPFSSNGTLALNSLTPASSACFQFNTAMSGFTTFNDVTFNNAGGNSCTDGFYIPSASGAPIWQALTQGGPFPQTTGTYAGVGAVTLTTNTLYQLSSDPGGFFDVFFQPSSTTSASAAFQMTMEVEYIMA